MLSPPVGVLSERSQCHWQHDINLILIFSDPGVKAKTIYIIQ